jgi:uncharacterized protein YfdQ (DUF2303 family)
MADSNPIVRAVSSSDIIRTEADAVAEIAQAACQPLEVEPGKIYWAQNGRGEMETLDLTGDAYRYEIGLPPLRARGTFKFHQLGGFIDYINNHNHAEDRAEIWADCGKSTITAVLDGHKRICSSESAEGFEQAPGWGAHRAILEFQLTLAWQEWTAFAAKPHPQDEFANFLEDHLADVVEPDAADLLEIASSLSVTSGVQFKQAIRLANGEVSFQYTEEHNATGGRQNQLKIPTSVTLALTPFEGGAAFKVPARFRYSLREGKLSMRLILDRPDQILRSSIDDVCREIAAATNLIVYHGIPAGPL